MVNLAAATSVLKQPQLFVCPFLNCDVLTTLLFPQSHLHNQRVNCLLFDEGRSTTSLPNLCPVRLSRPARNALPLRINSFARQLLVGIRGLLVELITGTNKSYLFLSQFPPSGLASAGTENLGSILGMLLGCHAQEAQLLHP